MAHCISGGGKFRSSAAMQPTNANDYNEGASNDDRDFSNDNGDDGSNVNGAEMDVEIIPWRVAGLHVRHRSIRYRLPIMHNPDRLLVAGS